MLFITIIIIIYFIYFIVFCSNLGYVLYKEHEERIKKRKLDHSRLEMNNTLIESKYYIKDGEFGRLPSILEVDEFINSDGEFTDSDEEDELMSSQKNV